MASHDPEGMFVNTVELIRARIARGMMPSDLETLLERRGTIEEAARDLASFTGVSLVECRLALETVYEPTA